MIKKTIKNISAKIFFKFGAKQNLIFNDFVLRRIGVRDNFHKIMNEKGLNNKTTDQILENNKKVLFFRMRFVPRAFSTEFVLAHIFKNKGWDPIFVACNSILSICNGWDIRNEEKKNEKLVCKICEYNFIEISKNIPYPTKFIANYLSKDEILEVSNGIDIINVDELKNLTIEDVNLDDEIYLSLAKFLFKGSLNSSDLEYAQRFVKSSTLLVKAFKKIIEIEKPDLVIMNCGHIFWFGIAYKILKKHNVKVITYDETNIAVTHLTWTFDSLNPTVDYNWIKEWDVFKSHELNNNELNQINELIQERQKYFLYQKDQDTKSFRETYDITKYKYKFSLFTNVLWDATVVGKNEVYSKGLIDWVKQTIRIIEEQPEACLVIRVHPAEKKVYGMSSRERVIEELYKWKSNFKDNIIFIDSESTINSYEIVDCSDVVLIYATNLGLEAVLKNKMVIVTGPAHYRNKGFTNDPLTTKEYEEILTKIIAENYYVYPDMHKAIKYSYFAYIKTQFELNIFKDEHPHKVEDLNFGQFSELDHNVNLSNLVDWMILQERGYFIN